MEIEQERFIGFIQSLEDNEVKTYFFTLLIVLC